VVSGGTWPYADDWSAASDLASIDEDIAAAGYDVVTDDSPAPIGVTVDPSIAPTTPSRVSCESGDSRELCASTGFVPMATGGGVTLRMVGTAAIQPEIVMLEIVRVDVSTLGARVFTRVSSELGDATCERAQTPRLRATGSLVLSSADLSSPELLHGRADLNLDGADVTVSF
jgi:hypothetical protein